MKRAKKPKKIYQGKTFLENWHKEDNKKYYLLFKFWYCNYLLMNKMDIKSDYQTYKKLWEQFLSEKNTTAQDVRITTHDPIERLCVQIRHFNYYLKTEYSVILTKNEKIELFNFMFTKGFMCEKSITKNQLELLLRERGNPWKNYTKKQKQILIGAPHNINQTFAFLLAKKKNYEFVFTNHWQYIYDARDKAETQLKLRELKNYYKDLLEDQYHVMHIILPKKILELLK